MEIGRRGLLALGAGAALSSTASSCRDRAAPVAGPIAPSTRRPVTATDVAPRFPGDPGTGRLYYGASVPRSQPLRPWEERLGSTLSLHRSYFTPDANETQQLVKRCHDDLVVNRLPHVSLKPEGWTWKGLAQGRHDDWLFEMLDGLGALGAPLFFTMHHEPENDAGPDGMAPADFVAMQQHIISAAAERAPEVTVAPVLQHWTFDPMRDDIDPSAWLVPEAAVIGLDVYNPWSQVTPKDWRSFGSKVSEVLSWFEGRPLLVGEHGCRVDPSKPGLAAEWLRDAAEFARDHNFVAMSYFNSHVNSPDGTWALHGETEDAFAELLGAAWVARLDHPQVGSISK